MDKATILKALGEEYILMHPFESDSERSGRQNAVRGMAVRLGLYPELEGAIDAAMKALTSNRTQAAKDERRILPEQSKYAPVALTVFQDLDGDTGD